MKYYLAIDIGASSGRHIVGWRENGELRSEEIYRFPNGVTERDGHLVWDVAALFFHVKEGIKRAFAKYAAIESLAIDTWAVDYVLMHNDGEILPCYAYRDNRTAEAVKAVHGIIPFEELYAKTGIQFQPFNTVYQLYDDLQRGRLNGATDFLMIPEYLSYRLTGVKLREYTNATTTGLLSEGKFVEEFMQRLSLPKALFTNPVPSGTAVGVLTEQIAAEVGGNTQVVLCASHDTASAVEGIPMQGEQPYISSGTWSLLGVKVKNALCDENSRRANYSNEGGVGYYRYQKNIMGMWLINSLRKELCPDKGFDVIEREARGSAFEGVVDADDTSFLAPKSMKGAFDGWFEGKAERPQNECDYFKCAMKSLAESYRRAIDELEHNLGKTYDKLYIVGGGAKNKFLNELAGEACKKEIVAIPIEATSVGNLKIQMEKGEKI